MTVKEFLTIQKPTMVIRDYTQNRPVYPLAIEILSDVKVEANPKNEAHKYKTYIHMHATKIYSSSSEWRTSAPKECWRYDSQAVGESTKITSNQFDAYKKNIFDGVFFPGKR